jgi:hypothetical protein
MRFSLGPLKAEHLGEIALAGMAPAIADAGS